MLSVVAFIAWSVFLGGGLLVAASERRRAQAGVRFRLVNVFILLTLAISFTPGIAQRSLWPFDTWQMFRWIAPQQVGTLVILGVDSDGSEHRIDTRAWRPMSFEELASWLNIALNPPDTAVADAAAADLLVRANAARERALRGSPPARHGLLPEFVTAPSHYLHRKPWSDSAAVPKKPFERILIVRESWDVLEGRPDDPSRLARDSLYVFPRVP